MKLIQMNNSFNNIDKYKLEKEIKTITEEYIENKKNENCIYLYLNNIEKSSLLNAYTFICFLKFIPSDECGTYYNYKLQLSVMLFYMSSIFNNEQLKTIEHDSIGDMFIKLVCYIEVWKEIEINDESFNDDKYEEFKNKVINLKILENKLEELNQNNKNLFFDNKI